MYGLIHTPYASKIGTNSSVVSLQTQIKTNMLPSFLLIAEKTVWLFKDKSLFICWIWEGKGYRKKIGFFFFLTLYLLFSLAWGAHQYWQQMTQLISIAMSAMWGPPWMWKAVQNWAPVDHWSIVFWRTIDWVWVDRAVCPLSLDCPSLPSTLPVAPFSCFPVFIFKNFFWHYKKYKLRSGCCGSCSRWNCFGVTLPIETHPGHISMGTSQSPQSPHVRTHGAYAEWATAQ